MCDQHVTVMNSCSGQTKILDNMLSLTHKTNHHDIKVHSLMVGPAGVVVVSGSTVVVSMTTKNIKSNFSQSEFDFALTNIV